MKLSILIVGLIALAMLAVPAMAADSLTTAIQATGTVDQRLSISAEQNIDFGPFKVGDNRVDNGNIIVTSEFVPNWKVTAATTDGYGYMRIGGGGVGITALSSKLQQYNYKSSAWEPAHGLTFGGSASTTMQETFLQNVLISDTPGAYSTMITYTISAV
jgi:spore coat protein U-like protein